jgi:hypothetical protein
MVNQTVELHQTLSMKYFEIANIVVAFQVAQSILFLNGLHKQKAIVDVIGRAGVVTFCVLILSTAAYCAALYGCWHLQTMLIREGALYDLARLSAWEAFLGRVGIVIAVACISGLIFGRIISRAKADARKAKVRAEAEARATSESSAQP